MGAEAARLILAHAPGADSWSNQDVVGVIKRQLQLLLPGVQAFLDIDNLASVDELEQYVEVGMTPLEALYSATVKPAEFFGLDNEMGQLKAGFMADAVLLSANPLESIQNTRGIEAVIHQGQLLSRAHLNQLVAK